MMVLRVERSIWKKKRKYTSISHIFKYVRIAICNVNVCISFVSYVSMSPAGIKRAYSKNTVAETNNVLRLNKFYILLDGTKLLAENLHISWQLRCRIRIRTFQVVACIV